MRIRTHNDGVHRHHFFRCVVGHFGGFPNDELFIVSFIKSRVAKTQMMGVSACAFAAGNPFLSFAGSGFARTAVLICHRAPWHHDFDVKVRNNINLQTLYTGPAPNTCVSRGFTLFVSSPGIVSKHGRVDTEDPGCTAREPPRNVLPIWDSQVGGVAQHQGARSGYPCHGLPLQECLIEGLIFFDFTPYH